MSLLLILAVVFLFFAIFGGIFIHPVLWFILIIAAVFLLVERRGRWY